MGNLCNKKRKSSDATSVKSEGSNKKDSAEGLENHSNESKRPSQNGQGTAAATSSEVAESSKKGGPAKSRVLKDLEPSSVSGESMSVSSPTATQQPGNEFEDSSLHPLTLPTEMRKQSDNTRHLLTGRINHVKPNTKCKKITLYICTTDSQDFRLEKGDVHTKVYPKLREYAANHGYELHITDLHWKTDLEEKQDHEFPELCIRELKRQLEVAYVVPVLFLSNSLGPSLLPKTVEQQDFENTLKNVSDSDQKAILQKWFSLDPNAQPPCYRLKPAATHIPKIKSENPEERKEGYDRWGKIIEMVIKVFLNVFPNDLRDTYLTTVIEQEIHNSIFMSREVGKRSIWINRVFTHIQSASGDSAVASVNEMEKTRRHEALQNEIKTQLVAGHILRKLVKWQDGGLSTSHPEHVQYLTELSDQLTSQLQSIIDEIMEEDKSKSQTRSCYGIEGSLCLEVMQHTMFCQQAAKCSLSVESPINAVKAYIGSDKTSPLIVHGPKGCGKTCFLSRIVQQVSSWFPDAFLVFRFVGITSDSKSLLQLLRSITSQLSVLIHGRNYWIPHNLKCYQSELYKMLSPVSPVVIIIDGLDELSPTQQLDLSWLAEELPTRMKLILSCSEETSAFSSIKAVIDQESSYVQLTPLSYSAGENLLTASILQYSHSLDTDLQAKLSTSLKHCTHPLFIKVLGWQASLPSVDVTEVNDVNSAVSGLFDHLEKMLGKDKVEQVLSLMCIARYGLCDSELLDLVSRMQIFASKDTFLEWAPATIFLAQLFQMLGPFLEWGLSSGDSVVVRWRDSTLADIAQKRYLGNKDAETKIRQLLLNYFQDEGKNTDDGRHIILKSNSTIGNRHLRRRLEEIPYQQYHISGSIKKDYLLKIDWLIQKIQNSSVYNVIEDIWLEQSKDKDSAANQQSELAFLCQIFELSASALNSSGQQFYGQVYDKLQPFFKSEAASKWGAKYPFIKSLYTEASTKPSLPSFIPITSISSIPVPALEEIQNLVAVNSLQGHKSYYELDNSKTIHFNELQRLKDGNQFVISLSTDQEQICIWDAYTQEPIRTLLGVHNPNTFKIINDTRVVILCGRELHIYNLDSVSFVSKLKGVMNQKMPYFGIQDQDHVVTLSRNRMYVNLVNSQTGDLESSFKVGEDRFLNSLIISENGKVCVCGDETQKPFPLLVWDLTSRKLVYDLRIPHHEFITSLSAITKEGHFVCCVCQELDDPGPNFIVVYDLQSGTLFKKWKPNCNTHALEISGQGSCVIDALEDNRILVWDLVTGACQWTLDKHTAPVDTLKLDAAGSKCLSCDSSGRDRNICLWNITKGQLLAIFTPDVPFTACEVFNNGEGVVLGLRGRSEILTLLYRHNESIESNRPAERYGSQANFGKITNMKST